MRRWTPSLLAVAARPGLWLEAVRLLLDLAPRDWWRRPSHLPVPDRLYLAWRLTTAYGSSSAPLQAADLVSLLRWRREQRRARGNTPG